MSFDGFPSDLQSLHSKICLLLSKIQNPYLENRIFLL